jgi:hypothetical protein
MAMREDSETLGSESRRAMTLFPLFLYIVLQNIQFFSHNGGEVWQAMFEGFMM